MTVKLAVRAAAVEPVRVDEHTGKRFTFFADPDDLGSTVLVDYVGRRTGRA